MNFQAILIANFTGLILLVFLFISHFITRTESQAEDHTLGIMMWLVALACIVEPLTFYVDGKPGRLAYWTNLLGNTYLYFANGLGSFYWCIFVDKSLYHSAKRLKQIYFKLSFFVAAMLLSLLFNLWGGFYFYVDEANVYHRRPPIYFFYFYMIGCCIFSIAVAYSHRRKYGKTAFFPIFMYLIPIVTGSVLQMVYYGVSLAWLGTAVGIVALYMSLLNQKSYLDPLTGLYNRQYLEHFIYEMQRSAGSFYGIMIDMNYFKEINDLYGHSAGDQALKDMANVLRAECLDRNYRFFRFAGDEFIVLMKTDDEEMVCAFEKQLADTADRFNEEHDRPYEVSFSAGHGIYDKANDTTDSFLKRIDKAMYKRKAAFHQRHDLNP